MDKKRQNKALKQDPIQKKIKDALNNPEITEIYFNGFTNAVGNGDILTILEKNNKPVAILNMSYSIAKTLVEKLGGLIQLIENNSGNSIMTTDDIQKLLNKDA